MEEKNYPDPTTGAALLLATALLMASCERPVEPPAEAPVATPAAATDGELPLPEFTPCDAEPPILPAKWAAKAVLQSFFINALVFGDFVYDETAAAFRFTLTSRYDLKELPGGLDVEPAVTRDLLVTEDGALYLFQDLLREAV